MVLCFEHQGQVIQIKQYVVQADLEYFHKAAILCGRAEISIYIPALQRLHSLLGIQIASLSTPLFFVL